MHFGTFSDTQRILLQPGKLLHQSPVLIEIGLERAPFVVFVYFFPSFEHAKNLLIMGPNNTKNSSKSVIFHMFNYV